MNKQLRSTLTSAAEIIEQYAEELRRSNVINGAWKGQGVTKIREEWGEMIGIARELRAAAETK